MLVAKWGNSLAVRLPAAVVEALKLKEGDDIAMIAASALHANCDTLWSEHMQSGLVVDGRLRIRNPFEA